MFVVILKSFCLSPSLRRQVRRRSDAVIGRQVIYGAAIAAVARTKEADEARTRRQGDVSPPLSPPQGGREASPSVSILKFLLYFGEATSQEQIPQGMESNW